MDCFRLFIKVFLPRLQSITFITFSEPINRRDVSSERWSHRPLFWFMNFTYWNVQTHSSHKKYISLRRGSGVMFAIAILYFFTCIFYLLLKYTIVGTFIIWKQRHCDPLSVQWWQSLVDGFACLPRSYWLEKVIFARSYYLFCVKCIRIDKKNIACNIKLIYLSDFSYSY